MAEREIFVVLDPFVLREGLFGQRGSACFQAIEVLNRNCLNRAIVNDNMNQLADSYQYELRQDFPSFGSLRNELSIRVRRSDKLLEYIRTAQVGLIQGLGSQHSRFFRTALSVRPFYLVTDVPMWLESRFIERIRTDFQVHIVPTDLYLQLEG